MLYKKLGGDNFAAQVVGEAKLRQLDALDAPYLSASGPGFMARKRGDFREVHLDSDAHNPPPHQWQIATTFVREKVIQGQTKQVRSAALMSKSLSGLKDAIGWLPDTYLGRGLVVTFNVRPHIRAFKHSYDIEDDYVAVGNVKPRKEHRVWFYAMKPGYLSVGKVRPGQRKAGAKRLLLPVMQGLQKFVGYGRQYTYSQSEFPGFTQRGSASLHETVGLQKPTGFAGFHQSADGLVCTLLSINSKIVGTGGFQIPTAHATLDVLSFPVNLNPEAAQMYEVDLPMGHGGAGQNLYAAMPFAVSPGVVCVITCEAFEPRQWYDGKMQGDFYISWLDLRIGKWLVQAKKIVPEFASEPMDYPYPEYQVLGLAVNQESGQQSIVQVGYGDTTKRLLYSVAYDNQDTRAYDYVTGVEAGVGQPCCESDSVIFAFVRFRGVKTSTPVAADVLVTRSTDIFIMKIDRNGLAKTTRLNFPHSHYENMGLAAGDYQGMYSNAAPQHLSLICVGKGKFLLHIFRYSGSWKTSGDDYATPPTAFFNYAKFVLTEDDGNTWQVIDPSGLPLISGAGPSAAELGKPCVVQPLSKEAYQAGDFAQMVIPLFTSTGNGMAYYCSNDGGRSWNLERSLRALDKPEFMTGTHDDDLRASFSYAEPLGLRVPPGLGFSNIYQDIFVRPDDLPDANDLQSTAAPQSITEKRLQRIFIGNKPAPMDLVRPWIYDADYLKG